jgi:undecaprenyl-diphosphatase
MLWFIIIFLAIVQGITEFLPVSSSGHLVVVQELFKQFGHALPERETLTLDVVLHVGTLLSVVVFFWRRIYELLTRDWRVIALVVVASIPAGIAGFTLKKQFEAMFENPLGVGCLFFVTGAMLLWADRRPVGETKYQEMTYWRALIVGLFQAVAILPGVSRSGSTITAGIGVGLRRQDAATFSFLLAIPAIAGAGLKEGYDRLWKGDQMSLLHGEFGLMLLVGAFVSFVVGLFALSWLIRWLEKGRLHWFAWWVFMVGSLVVGWQLSSLIRARFSL